MLQKTAKSEEFVENRPNQLKIRTFIIVRHIYNMGANSSTQMAENRRFFNPMIVDFVHAKRCWPKLVHVSERESFFFTKM